MGEEFRDRFRYVPLLFNRLKLKGGICMTKIPEQGPVSGNATHRSLMLLFSSVETGLFKGTQNCRETGHLVKEARHMQTTFSTILSSPPIRPMVESTQLLVRKRIKSAPATGMEECA